MYVLGEILVLGFSGEDWGCQRTECRQQVNPAGISICCWFYTGLNLGMLQRKTCNTCHACHVGSFITLFLVFGSWASVVILDGMRIHLIRQCYSSDSSEFSHVWFNVPMYILFQLFFRWLWVSNCQQYQCTRWYSPSYKLIYELQI